MSTTPLNGSAYWTPTWELTATTASLFNATTFDGINTYLRITFRANQAWTAACLPGSAYLAVGVGLPEQGGGNAGSGYVFFAADPVSVNQILVVPLSPPNPVASNSSNFVLSWLVNDGGDCLNLGESVATVIDISLITPGPNNFWQDYTGCYET